MNGSFEFARSGLPVNWYVFTPNTVPDSDFDIVVDQEDPKDGKNSLKFVVRKCASAGGRLSPGFTNEFEASPGKFYKISFWIRNRGSQFIIKAGGVTAKTGETKTIVNSSETINSWRLVEYKYALPKEYNRIAFELNIIQPGTFWIDDIKIEEIRLPQ